MESVIKMETRTSHQISIIDHQQATLTQDDLSSGGYPLIGMTTTTTTTTTTNTHEPSSTKSDGSTTNPKIEEDEYGESPSSESFNIDPLLNQIILKNREIIQSSQPRFKLYPSEPEPGLKLGSSSSDDEHRVRVRVRIEEDSSLIHIISKTELTKLGRLDRSETLYFHHFNPIIRQIYSSSSDYLIQRLNFRSSSSDPLRLTHFSSDPQRFIDGLDYRVIPNEWPYSIPSDYRHMIVWSRLPLIDPSRAHSSDQLTMAYERGLSGFENLTEDLIDRLNRFNLNDHRSFPAHPDPDPDPDPEPEPEPGDHHHPLGLDREIRRFIRLRWPLQRGFINLIWFLNPVYLQSCPQLAHFHVLVKRLSP